MIAGSVDKRPKLFAYLNSNILFMSIDWHLKTICDVLAMSFIHPKPEN